MKWGSFGVVHILTLIAGAAMVLGLYFGLRKASEKTKTWVLGILSFSGIAAIIYNLLAWDAPLLYLPLHLCSLNAIMLPVAVLTRNKTVGNLLLVWSLGALAALVLNYEMVEVELCSWVFFFYYFPHVMEFGIPILLFALGMVKKDPKCIVSTVGISMGAYTIVHFLNLAVNAHLIAMGSENRVNYMFSMEGTNPLTDLFCRIIPAPYWHMYMIIPILVVYLLGVYAPQLIKKKAVN